MALQCPECGADILAENINMQRMVVLCQDCNHVFEFGDHIPGRKNKPRLHEQPPRVQLRQDDDNRLEMAYRWVYGRNVQVGLLATTVGSFLLTLSFIAALNDPASTPLALVAFALIVSAFWYMAAVFALTTTRVIADNESLTTKSGPLPFPPLHDNKTLDWEEIRNIYCEETSNSKQAGKVERYFHVWVQLDGGQRLAIQKDLPEDHALYITQQLERFCWSRKTVMSSRRVMNSMSRTIAIPGRTGYCAFGRN